MQQKTDHKRMLKTLFRRYKQYQIVRKMKAVDFAVTNSATLTDLAFKAYPIHKGIKKSGDSTHPCLSPNTHGERLWFR